jgi:hypothetical protein
MTTLIPKFEQTGSTTNRPINLKLQETISVKDFGAVGDGVTDDTAAIQAAVNSVTNGTIYFPIGNYAITSPIQIDGTTKYSINFVGVGLGSEIVYTGTTVNDVMFYYYNGSNSTFVLVENLLFSNQFRTSDTAQNGIIAWRIGKKDDSATSGVGGVCNFTFRKNQVLYCDYGLQVWSESDQLTVEDNYFFVWNSYAVWCGQNPLVNSGTGSSSVRIHKNHMIGGQNGSWAVKLKGSNGSVVDNVIQNATQGAGVWVYNSEAFTISSNYTESTGSSSFILIDNSVTGYIGENTIGAYPGSYAIDINATSSNINIGQNFFSTSGGYPAALIRVNAAATGVNILGAQYQTEVGGGGITGPVNFQIDGSGNVNSVATISGSVVNSGSGLVNISGVSSSTIFTAVAKTSYIVSITQGAEHYSETALVTVPDGSTTAIVTPLYTTNSNLTLSASGLNIQANNGIGITRTVTYSYIRIL